MKENILIYLRAFWLVASMCALFTATASAGAIFLTAWHGEMPESSFLIKTTIKGGVFLALSLGTLWRLRASLLSFAKRDRERIGGIDGNDERNENDGGLRIEKGDLQSKLVGGVGFLVVVLLISAYIGLFRTETYPGIQPDESYHMVVARNLAEYGKYASGSTQEGFVMFDDYDSVGAPVIVPVAVAFKTLGTRISNGRIVSGLYFIALCVATFALVSPVFGTASALASVLFLCFSLMTPYLARTLYGEVPALFWLIAGLVSWRKSYANPNARTVYAILAGASFGLAVLSKEIMIFAAWPYVVSVLIDRMTHRRITLPGIIIPPFIAANVIGLFAFVKYLYHADAAATIGALDTYRHHLLFGFSGLPATLSWLLHHAWILLPTAIALCIVSAGSLGKKFDPSLLVLVLTACLFFYWWTFFTPGHISRYLWYTCAIMGICAGPIFTGLLEGLIDSSRPHFHRALAAVAAVVLAGSQIPETVSALRAISVSDETRHERALAAKLSTLPVEASIATTDWRLKRLMNLLANRSVTVVGRTEDAAHGAFLIVNLNMPSSIGASGQACATFGPYALFCPR
jgi:hypothetical protein